jgi:hypothetical protein
VETLEQLVESLQSQGRVDSRGVFQLDLMRARQRLGEFQLDRQELWLLPLIQLAHGWEAARIVVRFERDAAVVEILACQRAADLRPWLGSFGDPKNLCDKLLGPLALACEVALAASFGGIELSTPEASLWLRRQGLEGDISAFGQVYQLKLRLLSPALPWWRVDQKRLWSERIARACQQIRMRAAFSLSQPVIEGLDVRPELDVQDSQEVERVWLSSLPLRQLMAYPSPTRRVFQHDWVGKRLTRWREGAPQGLLRQWVHGEQKPLASDLHIDKAEHWLGHLAKNQTVTMPREVRWREGYLAARGVLQWSPHSQQAGVLVPLRWGISLGSLPLPRCPGVRAWLSADSWGTDLSQQKVLVNALARRSLEFVEAQFADLLGEVIEAGQLLPKQLGHLIEPASRAMPISEQLRPRSVRPGGGGGGSEPSSDRE